MVMNELPVLPAAHAQALIIVGDPAVEIADVAEAVSADPALTSAVLRAANSAASAPIEPVTTADRAVTRIGLQGTRNIVTAVVVDASLGNLHGAGIDPDELWRHLVICALVANEALEPGERGAAFTAGLLHDVGRMAMAHAAADRYAQVAEAVGAGADPRAAEQRVFGYDHEQCGAGVASAWALPGELIEAIEHHHEPGGSRLSDAVITGRRVASALDAGDGLLTPPQVAEPLTLDERVLVAALGGASALEARVGWFRGTLHSTAA
jgi:putative nucleotidyltransferase with HDIG domain